MAGMTATAMALGAGLVDVLRLGEGAAHGGLKGFVRYDITAPGTYCTLGDEEIHYGRPKINEQW